MTSELNLELLNGNWAIAAAALMLICAVYLWHEFRARRILPFGERRRLTDGIKIAIAVLTMSLGILIRSAETWRWRVFGGDLDHGWLSVGGFIAVVGFLCLIREKSRPLFGTGPWAWTLVAMLAFSIGTLIVRFW